MDVAVGASKDKNNQVGIIALNQSNKFILMFYSYDDIISDDYDYPMYKSFSKIYSATVELVVSFPMQVMLSKKRPPHEVRIDHIKESEEGNEVYFLP